MAEKPILFSTPMVQAILEGRKTMTRRVVKPQPKHVQELRNGKFETSFDGGFDFDVKTICPRYKPGDILWVRETWQSFFPEEVTPKHQKGPRSCSGVPAESAKGHYMYYYYRADGEVPDDPQYGHATWMPSIFLPRAAARIFLRVTDVRVERLQEITEEDAECEGVHTLVEWAMEKITGKTKFQRLWDRINAKRGYGWDTNPWVWVYSFERVEVGSHD